MPDLSINPYAPVSTVRGVGPKLQQSLAKLGIFRLIDLLLHLPFRYQDRTQLTPLPEVRADETHLIQGEIQNCRVVFGSRRSLKVTVNDGTGTVYLRFFHFSRYQQKALQEARFIRAFGEFRFFGRELSCAHPEYETFDYPPTEATPELVPIYPTTQGLGQARLRKILRDLCQLSWPDTSPFKNLVYLHMPPPEASSESIAQAQETLAIEELAAYYLVMKGRALARESTAAIPLPRSVALGRVLLDQLGFKLTQAQARVVGEVLSDLQKPTPMLRLVQGDVGSGKTVVAAFAAIRAAEQSCQTAVMAPTELLAEQHYLNFVQWLTPLGIDCVLLTGSQSAREQKLKLQAVADGEALVVIGTHALFQDRVSFRQLGLSVIDEQHRFGVHQRMALQLKGGTQPHQLIMTATPIPRTLTMALYADMAVSVIDELPKGRQPITTHTVVEDRIDEVIEQLQLAISNGEQVYWVCVLIEDSDEIDATSATTRYQELSQALPDVRVALLHGRLSGDEKAEIMNRFKTGNLDLLVATTVIEVGVDVPNATHIVIENAERLGLAQLHQLRGRIGRGTLASHCFLLFSQGLSEAAKTRLTALKASQDGFYLAEQDLKLRGPGDILGTRQSGEQSFRIADLGEHAHLIPKAVSLGDELMHSPDRAEHMRQVLETWAPADTGNLTV